MRAEPYADMTTPNLLGVAVSKIPLVAEMHRMLHKARGGSILAVLLAPFRAGSAHVVIAGPIGVRTAPGLAHPFDESPHHFRVGADTREHRVRGMIGHCRSPKSSAAAPRFDY